MKTIITNCFFLLLSLIHPFLLSARQIDAPFTAPSPSSSSILSFHCARENNRVFLNWTMSENETTYQFEVEKSEDGQHFTMAALIFGTDRNHTEQYKFFEKKRSTKTLYRIKIVYKDQTIGYSDVITCN